MDGNRGKDSSKAGQHARNRYPEEAPRKGGSRKINENSTSSKPKLLGALGLGGG